MSDYPQDAGKTSSVCPAYSVEARYNYHESKKIGDQIFDNRWRRVIFDTGPIGIPIAVVRHAELKNYSLFNYSAAQALRWWLHAKADVTMDGFCLETKLVKHEIQSESKCRAMSEHEIISGEDRSSSRPPELSEPEAT